MNDMERFIKEVCENCSQFYDCDSYWDEKNIQECMEKQNNEKKGNP